MAFNPFLSMNEPAAPATPEALNPFMMADVEPMAVTGDNPFAASNPFSDFGAGIEPPAGDTVPVDIFGSVETANIDAKLFDAYTGEAPPAIDIFSTPSIEQERVIKPTELDLVSTTTGTNFISEDAFTSQQPPRPLPPETQNLILSVTGQMDITSSHLLDRIPPTRTPSPVSIRDIHSPSPTPEPEFEEDEKVQEPIAPVPSETLDINRNKPTRPPPARPPPATRAPPPRPAPPPPPPKQRPPPSQPQAVHQEPAADDINLFDAPAKVTVKPTMEAIMSLYTAPKKEEKPIDFLSDDLLEDIPATEDLHAIKKETSEFVPEDVHVSPVAAKTESEVSTGLFAMDTSAVEPVSQMDCSEPPNEVTSMNTSPFTDMATNNFEDYVPSSGEKNPFEISEDTSTTYLDNNAPNIFNVKSEDIVMESTDSHAVIAQTDNFESQIDNVFTTTSSVPFTAAPSEVFSTANSEPFAAVQDEAFSTAPSNVFSAAPTDAFASASNDAFNSDGFGLESGNFENSTSIPATDSGWGTSEAMAHDAFPESQDAFDAFSAKFDSTLVNHVNTGAWGDDGGTDNAPAGFEAEAFDPFLSMGAPPPPAATPRLDHQGSRDSADESFNLFIRPKESETSGEETAVPVLAPPPRPQALAESPRLFEDSDQPKPQRDAYPRQDERSRSGSGGETPPTPLFDEDVSVPLEEFPRVKYDGPGWEMHLRQPNKKKITGQRFWKKVFVRIAYQGDNPVVQLRNASTDKEPFQELPLQACYSVSDVGAQQFDQFGKIFTVKLQYVFYKERPGVRPGQVTKAERITNKLSQFAAYAIQGDYQGVKEFGSDLRKLGLPVEHAPQVSQLFKLGSLSYEDVKQFSACIEEALFRLPAHRDRALSYKMEEMQITAVDELYVEQDAEGSVQKQIARVRLFFLGFLTGMPDIELGVNDLRRQGREVVGRHDIIPVITEEWIRVEDTEFHACVQPHEFYNTQLIKFKPPDACYIELMRFRIRPPKNRELPLQLKAQWCVNGNKVELRADVLVPGFASRKLGQVPCEDVAIRFPIPEAWIYLFRVEKHFRYGSVKSAHRRTGKIKGIERFLGAVDNLQESLIEVTSGQAKYEHQHRAIVWRMPRLPKEGQGAYTTHNLVCRMALTSFDQIPAQLATHALVEFTMPATQVSHVTVRSAALQPPPDEPPEKYVRYLARHEYIVGIERTSGQSAPAYAVAAAVEHAPAPPTPPAPPAPLAAPQPPSSDSDSD